MACFMFALFRSNALIHLKVPSCTNDAYGDLYLRFFSHTSHDSAGIVITTADD